MQLEEASLSIHLSFHSGRKGLYDFVLLHQQLLPMSSKLCCTDYRQSLLIPMIVEMLLIQRVVERGEYANLA